jgi:zinc transport system permease protein
MSGQEWNALVLALLFAFVAGAVGSLALSRRMLLAGDVLSHLALPGLGLALLLHLNPLLGAAVSLLLGTVLVWHLEQRTGLAADVTIGVVFATALALGAVLTPREELLEALFGRFGPMPTPALLIGMGVLGTIVTLLVRLRDGLLLHLFSPELAAATGVRLAWLELLFLLMFSLTVLVGLRFLGALLASSLVILPAAIGRRFARSMRSFFAVSALAGMVSVTGGFLLSRRLPGIEFGPAVVLLAALLFVGSFAWPAGEPS